MNDNRNRSQIIRIDARNCFVESLNDAFEIGKAHFTFASYDLSKPSGRRQTNSIQIYIDMAEVLELCRKLVGGELRYLMQAKKKNGDSNAALSVPWRHFGGKARKVTDGHERMGKVCRGLRSSSAACKTDFLFVADSGPGETNAKGLIVPRFGKNPENPVSVSMTFELLQHELMLMTKTHYQSWLTAYYLHEPDKTSDIAGAGNVCSA